MRYLGDFLLGSTVYVPFDTFDGGTGASITMSGLAVTDIEIFKNGGTTTRASDTGYTLLDTDGIDFNSRTGLHGFSIDLSSDADAGFFVPGEYMVAVDAITIDGQTVRFWAATFSIQNRYYPGLIARGVLQSATATTAVLASATSFANDLINGATLVIVHGTGKGQSRLITDWVSASDTATVDTWTTTPDNTSYYEVYASPPASSTVFPAVNVEQINAVTVLGAGTSEDKWRA